MALGLEPGLNRFR